MVLLATLVDTSNDSIADGAIDSFQTIFGCVNGSLLVDDGRGE